ncbi:hypothetical protein [Nocardia sp. NBC_01329]|uniref:hypothetical protein n=1 Tax=Nocardia sp. NBC_01329 TaxID=2903594 RepID=UPI002E150EF8|nr:hypothetical protein OG405_13470 [Nocardia sp. NBC_01329]
MRFARFHVDAVSIFQPYQAQVIQALGADAIELSGDELGTWAKTRGSIDAATRLPDYTNLLDDRFLPPAE